MRLMLTSCGLETEKIKGYFLEMLGKDPCHAKALFIPTAAIDADAVEVLPKCMHDLLKCGFPKENIRVYDLHADMPADELNTFDVVYFCGGRTAYLLERINDSGFRGTLLNYIREDGFVIGSARGVSFSRTTCQAIWVLLIQSWMSTATGAALPAGSHSRWRTT